MLLALALVASLGKDVPTRDFHDYVRRPDASFTFSAGQAQGTRTDISLTSQTWQGIPWKHTIVVLQPAKLEFKGRAILHITGGEPNAKETAEYQLAANMAGVPIAALYNIPNQPLWGMNEDDLIAHTFEKYLETGDPSWPLLFPMAKSAIRAMDAVQGASKGTSNPIRKFMVTGASKRGWTTWFVGISGDKRVDGIAPLVIDNLNVTKQMKHQLASWGKYSEQIEDYTRRGLQQKTETDPRGKRLAEMIDPYSYRSTIKVPTMIINGGNDRYWAVDALSQYWDDLRQPKWAQVVPNVGHSLVENRYMAMETLIAFSRSLAGEFTMPALSWKFDEENENGERSALVQLKSAKTPLANASVWMVTSDTLDFRPAKWERVAITSTTPPALEVNPTLRVGLPRGKNVALLGEFRYRVNGREFSLSTPVRVFPAMK
ncbi:MAG: PhoPQ-activated protein PqaA family protein [Fimbriimonas sp.]